MLVVLFIQWHKAAGPIPKEFKVWMMLYILEKFCLGCTLSVLSSQKLYGAYPNLFFMPLALGVMLYVFRRKWFSNWKKAQSNLN